MAISAIEPEKATLTENFAKFVDKVWNKMWKKILISTNIINEQYQW